MCGIAGFVDFENNIKKYTEHYYEMEKSLSNRGPDSSGIYSSDDVCLIHSRLAVVDIENGKQPMIFDKCEQNTILVYNGELYNTEDIRKELLEKGYKFNGHSDTEVLLCSYIEWGEDCVQKLNGIYAFAIWDEKRKELFIARDRIGVKPFFYCVVDNNKFIFGSEIKALLKHPLVKAEIDTTSVAEIMLVGPGRTPGYGIFKNIQELKPGYKGYFNKNGLFINCYWSLNAEEHKDSLSETVEKLNFLVRDSIRRQIVSDVPICSFLSGGLDSSIIAAISGIKETFSVDYTENDKYFKTSKFQPESDNKYIKIMSDYLNTNHTTVKINTNDLVESLFSAVEARDLPGMADVDGSMLLFCKEVKKHVTVALSGECADEVFGGYPWYRDKDIRMIDGFPWSQSTAYRASFVKDEFLENIDPINYVYNKYSDTLKNTDKSENELPLEKRMKEMFKLNVDWFMQTLLDRKDRMSMYNGLEVRVPFCDHRIVEYLYNVPWEFKDYMGREKGLLRLAMGGVLPEEVLWRKKSPYPKTHNPEYLKRVSEILQDIINTPSSPLLDILKKEQLQNILNYDNSVPWYGQLMTTPQTIAYFIQINYWLDYYNISLT